MAFTSSELQKVLGKADAIWGDNIAQADYMANAEIVRAIKANQTVTFDALKDPDKDNKVKLTWINSCGIEADDYVADCTINGVELSTDSKEYTIDQPFEVSIKIKEETLRTNIFGYEEVYAKAFMKADKALAEKLAAATVAKLESWAAISANPYTADAAWNVPAAGITNIPQNQWQPDILGHFILAGKLSKFTNPYMVSGLNLAHRNWKAQLEAGQSGNEGNVEMFNQVRTYFDIFNVDSTAVANRTYLIDRNAVGIVSKNHYGNTPTTYGDGANLTRFSLASLNLEGVRYDVIHRTECERDEIVHLFKFIYRGGIFINPTGCIGSRTGLLGFHKA
jgi:hypothetical protein